MSTPPFCKACHAPLGDILRGTKNGFRLLGCPKCKTVTVDPFPTEDALKQFYQAYEGTTNYRSKADRKIKRARARIASVMKALPGKAFLDVGCNHGFTVKAALDLGLDAHGIDIDATAVANAKDHYGADKFTTVPVYDFADGVRKFDMIYSSEVIEHVPDPDKFAEALSKLLNPGGMLFLTTPDGGHFSLPRDFSKWSAVTPPEHIIYFTKKGLQILFERHGLRVKKFFFNFKPGIKVIATK